MEKFEDLFPSHLNILEMSIITERCYTPMRFDPLGVISLQKLIQRCNTLVQCVTPKMDFTNAMWHPKKILETKDVTYAMWHTGMSKCIGVSHRCINFFTAAMGHTTAICQPKKGYHPSDLTHHCVSNRIGVSYCTITEHIIGYNL